MTTSSTSPAPSVALFVTCMVDLFRPSVGFAAVKLLEDAGCTVTVPRHQTCCGQPAYNSGDTKGAKKIAHQVIDVLEAFEYVVLPSGSCAGMIVKHYPEMFAGDPAWEARAVALAGRTFELTSFLNDVLKVTEIKSDFKGQVAYHDSCAGLRELAIKDQPRALLGRLNGVEVAEVPRGDECCGFGGSFSVTYGDISTRMVARKTASIAETGAPTLLGGDLACLMNIAGRLRREGKAVQVRHVAEALAGMTDLPAIGEPLNAEPLGGEPLSKDPSGAASPADQGERAP